MQPGAAQFFDGLTARRHDVHVDLHRDRMALTIHGDTLDGPLVWSLADLRAERDEADPGRLTLMRRADTTDETPRDPARLILLDPEQITWVRRTRPQLFRRDTRPGTARRVALWAGGAVGAVVLMLFVILPAMANTLARLIPLEREVAFGKSVAAQMETALGRGRLGDLSCTDQDGLAALTAMVARLSDGQDLGYTLNLKVIDHPMVNAFAAPGGQIVILRGLLDKATSPDEVAGVLAHEIGHVEARDPTRVALRAAGSAGLLTMLLGDFTGGTALALVGERVLSASYTREAEAAADVFALDMLAAADVSAAGFADFFERMAAQERGLTLPEYLASHPDMGRRLDGARAFAQAQSGTHPALSEAQWQALKSVCRGRPADKTPQAKD